MDTTKDFEPALTLSSDGNAWRGTFGVLVRALGADLLDEGPLEVRLRTLNGATITGQWTAIEGMNILVDGTQIDVEDIEELSIT